MKKRESKTGGQTLLVTARAKYGVVTALWSGVASLLLVLAAAGCGGSSNTNPGTMCTASDCGGNPVGQWQVKGACGTLTLPAERLCQGATGQLAFTGASGTLNVAENMTYEQQVTLNANGTVVVPGQCAKEASINSCPEAATLLMSALNNIIGTGSVTNTQCTGNIEDKCTCTFVVVAMVPSSGQWARSGNQVMITPTGPGAQASTQTFCQKDNTMAVKNAEGWGMTLTK